MFIFTLACVAGAGKIYRARKRAGSAREGDTRVSLPRAPYIFHTLATQTTITLRSRNQEIFFCRNMVVKALLHKCFSACAYTNNFSLKHFFVPRTKILLILFRLILFPRVHTREIFWVNNVYATNCFSPSLRRP